MTTRKKVLIAVGALLVLVMIIVMATRGDESGGITIEGGGPGGDPYRLQR